jgi:hypothetical protein
MVNVAITTICDMVDHCRLRLDDISPTATVPVTNQELIDAAAEVADESELLWTEAELRHYANEAIKEVALRTLCIRDSGRNTAGLTLYPLVAPANTITVDRRVLLIKRVWWNGVVLQPESEKFLDEAESPLSAGSWRTNTKENISHFVLERASRQLQTLGIPTVDGNIALDVVRLPLETLETGIPEIPQHYLSDCLDWMCHLAYLKNDADTKDMKQSANFETLFTGKVGPRPTDLILELDYHQQGRRRPRLYWF